MPSDNLAITIRPAYADDDAAVRRLAALDDRRVPAGPLVLAEVDGDLRAAVSTADLTAIANPFESTAELVALVQFHIERSRSGPPRSRRVAMVGGRAA